MKSPEDNKQIKERGIDFPLRYWQTFFLRRFTFIEPEDITELIINPAKNITLIENLMKIILKYSAVKIEAKHPPKYSVLNPDTNSDSPSTKSKGVRFISVNMLIKNIK